MIKVCKVCGREYEDVTFNYRHKYCSQACAREGAKSAFVPFYKYKKHTKNMREIISLDAQAKEQHLSYGQYISSGMAAELTKIDFPAWVKETRNER